MAQIKPSSFTSYSWANEMEEATAAILTYSNKMFIQNELCRLAEIRLALAYDAEKPITFVQGEADLKGKIQILQWLLDASDAGEAAVREEAATRSS